MAQAQHTPNPTVHKLDRLTNWLMALIIAIPFLLSFGALRDLAQQKAVAYPWLFPVMVDGGLIIFKALVLRASLHGRADWYAWTMAALATAVSVVLNVLHAPADWLAQAMAALPPLVILAAFVAVARRVQEDVQVVDWQKVAETAVQESKRVVQETEKRVQDAESALQTAESRLQASEKGMQDGAKRLQAAESRLQAETKQRKALESNQEALQKQVQTLQAELNAWQTINATAQVAAKYNAGEFATLQDAADQVGVSPSTISRLAANLNGGRR